VPVIIGGRGEAAVRRAARYGDGWLAIFCSPRRFGQTRQQIADAAAASGRTPPAWYGINVWCGLDADPQRARRLLARQLETLYHLPFERFERVAVAGTPAQVAGQLAPFVEAGAANLTVVPVAASAEAGVEHVAAVRAALQRESSGVGPASGILG
jgi:alkanesulfonate monooxygenase SsuD/methylene tetrahydromethanopterin reductase-like flavin-dependent oxidoreductase (luciferase family)